MLKELQRILEKNPDSDEAVLKRASSLMLQSQFLYFENTRQRLYYKLIVRYFDYFESVFDAIGWSLYHDADFAFVGIVPQDQEQYMDLRLEETLYLFTLRIMYEEGMEQFHGDKGSVIIEGEQFLQKFEALTQRERPKTKQAFLLLMRVFTKHGLVQLTEDESYLPQIKILPAIRVIAGKETLARLNAFNQQVDEDDTLVETPPKATPVTSPTAHVVVKDDGMVEVSIEINEDVVTDTTSS